MGTRQARRKIGETIAWLPAHDAHYIVAGMRGASRTAPPLYATQGALVKLDKLLTTERTPLPFGLLLGATYVEPNLRSEYLLLEDAVPSDAVLTPDDPMTQLRQELRSLLSAEARQQSTVVGWYLGGLGNDLTLDEQMLGLHRELFPEPQHLVLVHGNDAGVAQGVFLRFDSVEQRAFQTPFSEVLPERSRKVAQGDPPSAVGWTSYRANRPVAPRSEDLEPAPLRHARTDRRSSGDVASVERTGTGSRGLLSLFRGRANGSAAPPSRAEATQRVASLSVDHHTSRGADADRERQAAARASLVSDAPVATATPAYSTEAPTVAPRETAATHSTLVEHEPERAPSSQPRAAPPPSGATRRVETHVPHVLIGGGLVPLPTDGQTSAPEPRRRSAPALMAIAAIAMLLLLVLLAYAVAR